MNAITSILREERIGGQRLILGDFMEVLPILGQVDSIITDPPFEEQAHTPMRRTRKTAEGGGADVLDFAAITEEQRAALPAWARENCAGWMLAFCQIEAVAAWRDAMEAARLKYKRGMVWVKPDSSPQFNGQGPAQGFECIASAWCGKGHSRWNGGGRRGVFTHNTRQPDRHGTHKTEKPLPLMRELVELFTDAGAAVLDPFMGSGTTLVACQQLGRRGVGIELNPDYFEIACQRVEEATRQADLFVAPLDAAAQVDMFKEAQA